MTDSTRHAALPAPNGRKLILELLEPMRERAVRTWEFDDRAMVRIGRAGDNDVALSDVWVSRHHLEISFREGAWEFVSMGRFGTFVGGQVVDRVTLEEGAILQLGALGPRLRFLKERAATNHTAGAAGERPQADRRQAVTRENPRQFSFRRVEDRARKARNQECSPTDETLH